MAARANTKSFLEALRRVAGPDAVEALARACGGSRIYIPHDRLRSADSALARAFGGVEPANAIIAKLNDAGICRVIINMPVSRSRLGSPVRTRVRDALLAGHSVADVAHTIGITERTVFRYRRELVAECQLTKRAS